SMLQRINGREALNDEDFKDQWQHAEKLVDGKGGFGLNSIPAWDITMGVIRDFNPQRPVRVAIIDNGMDIDHTDLQGAIVDGGFFTAPAPGSGDATFTRFTQDMPDFPSRGHGTFCLGMVGARQNNHNGGCGVAPESHLIALACAQDQIGNQLTLARAIEFAVNPRAVDPAGPPTLGADIISCSLRTASVLETVLKAAIDSTATGRNGLGIPIFWAVSNRDEPISQDKVCSLETVIAVGRSNREGDEDGSASGPELDFLAPGREVFGPTEGIDNVFDSGTSFAAPLAAGVAALVMALHPDWNAQRVREHLQVTCIKPNGHVRDDKHGFGRVNAHQAVQLALEQ
ncbi:MAG TPA: S8 family serine peptidase, partial [Pyrinomonadaceae bacterium]|nr:S8 family serine peptidase [Pyrinomonadaceae bacterium]